MNVLVIALELDFKDICLLSFMLGLLLNLTDQVVLALVLACFVMVRDRSPACLLDLAQRNLEKRLPVTLSIIRASQEVP